MNHFTSDPVLKDVYNRYRYAQLLTIAEEAGAFISTVKPDEMQIESVHSMRTSARRIVAVSTAYRRFFSIRQLDHTEKMAAYLLKITSKARNLDVLRHKAVAFATDRDIAAEQGESEIEYDFAKWLAEKRLREQKRLLKRMHDKDFYGNLQKCSRALAEISKNEEERDSRGCFTFTEAGAAIYYRAAADVVNLRRAGSCLHKLRLACKDFRYILELFEFAGLNVSEYQEKFKLIQDDLGRWHDYILLVKQFNVYCREKVKAGSAENVLIFYKEQLRSAQKIAEETVDQLTVVWFNDVFNTINGRSK